MKIYNINGQQFVYPSAKNLKVLNIFLGCALKSKTGNSIFWVTNFADFCSTMLGFYDQSIETTWRSQRMTNTNVRHSVKCYLEK